MGMTREQIELAKKHRLKVRHKGQRAGKYYVYDGEKWLFPSGWPAYVSVEDIKDLGLYDCFTTRKIKVWLRVDEPVENRVGKGLWGCILGVNDYSYEKTPRYEYGYEVTIRKLSPDENDKVKIRKSYGLSWCNPRA